MPNGSQNHMTAGNEAVISSGSCQDRSTVSRNTCTVMKLWLTINGAANVKSSQLPPGRGAARAVAGADSGTRADSVGSGVDSAGSSISSPLRFDGLCRHVLMIAFTTRRFGDKTPGDGTVCCRSGFLA